MATATYARLQRKPDTRASPRRPKAKPRLVTAPATPSVEVGPANDAVEQEADAMADALLAGQANLASSIRLSAAGVRGKCAACESEEEVDGTARRAPTSASTRGPAPAPSSALGRIRQSIGRPLPAAVRTWAERGFGVSFASTRIHTGSDAAVASHALQAQAFAIGENVFFGPGQFSPTSSHGAHLIGHELAHVVQARRGGARLRRAPVTEPSYETVSGIYYDAVAGAFRTSNDFEERIRRLTSSELAELRGLLNELLVPATSGEPYSTNEISELIQVLDNVKKGYVGGTVGHVAYETGPCEPGAVQPVSAREWSDDPLLAQLEEMGRNNDKGLKLTRRSPTSSIALFQRSLIQWGCEWAVPAANPLYRWGADGVLGGETKNAIGLFQKEQGLSKDGVAGPQTVLSMAATLWSLQDREAADREAEQSTKDEILDQLAREARIERAYEALLEIGEHHTHSFMENPRTWANHMATWVLARGDFTGSELNAALLRLSRQKKPVYDRIMHGGELILQFHLRGIWGFDVDTPSGGGFVEGYRIKMGELLLGGDNFGPLGDASGVVEGSVAFFAGVAEGAAKALVDTATFLWSLRDEEVRKQLWKAATEVIPKVVAEPAYRFQLGAEAAVAMDKATRQLNRDGPVAWLHALGVGVGALVFEVVLGMATAGAAAAVKAIRVAEVAHKFPGLVRLSKRIGSVTAVRIGLEFAKTASTVLGAAIAKADELLSTVARLFPESSYSKIGKAVQALDAEDAAIALKFDEVLRLRDDLDRLRPGHLGVQDQDQALKISGELDQSLQELEQLLIKQGYVSRTPDGKLRRGSDGEIELRAGIQVSKSQMDAIMRGAGPTHVSDLGDDLFDELDYVRRAIDVGEARPSTFSTGGKAYDLEVQMPNGHKWRRDKDRGTWCRFSTLDPTDCGHSPQQLSRDPDSGVHDKTADAKILEDPGTILVESTPTSRVVLDTTPGNEHYFARSTLLPNGDLVLDFRLTDGRSPRGALRGESQFEKSLAHFDGRVKAVRGTWERVSDELSTNWDIFWKQYKKHLEAGLPWEEAVENAAMKTRTGEWSSRRGFAGFEYIDHDPPITSLAELATLPNAGTVQVRFTPKT